MAVAVKQLDVPECRQQRGRDERSVYRPGWLGAEAVVRAEEAGGVLTSGGGQQAPSRS